MGSNVQMKNKFLTRRLSLLGFTALTPRIVDITVLLILKSLNITVVVIFCKFNTRVPEYYYSTNILPFLISSPLRGVALVRNL
ncbi:hypothetical protein BDV37DRAFT_264836 [Aspergillus pseudonomiae]|uniref:Uncharacterized protein n=1 Tax=Aspergillus pseudonomiae TaxID=1506151 RepID=A0A5N7CUF3_9EURO|nr:uncharacterized protein BDV37DRAFT_264836 [Aspergillus pseudonomiae]KAE8397820.1 hypothetical protein BDV37DRAFT_264836 [Aspergillus pseudonomiae]